MAFKVGELFFSLFVRDNRAQQSMRNMERSTERVGASFKRLGGVIAAALSVKAATDILRLADSLQALDARLAASTKSTKEFNETQQSLLKTAIEVGGSFPTMVSLFDALKGVAPELKATNNQILLMVDIVSKLGAIGQTSAERQRDALTQFSQAMAGGILRAEEFNSIVENTPKLAIAIADGLKLTQGELRLAVVAGKVLAEDVFGAILSQADAVNERFAKIPNAMERAWDTASTVGGQYFKELDKGLGATEAIADAIMLAAKNIEDGLLPTANELKEPFLIIRDAAKDIDNVASFNQWQLIFNAATDAFMLIAKSVVHAKAAGKVWAQLGVQIVSVFKMTGKAIYHELTSAFEESYLSARVWSMKVAEMWAAALGAGNGTFIGDKIDEAEAVSRKELDVFLKKFEARKSIIKAEYQEEIKNSDLLIKLANEKADKEWRDLVSASKKRIVLAKEERVKLAEVKKIALEGSKATPYKGSGRIVAEKPSEFNAMLAAMGQETVKIENEYMERRSTILAMTKITEEQRTALMMVALAERDEKIKELELSLMQDPVSKIDQLKAQMGDETQAILNEHTERNAQIMALENASEAQRRELLEKSGEIRLEAEAELSARMLAAQEEKSRLQLSTMQGLSGDVLEILRSMGQEGTAIMKAAFLADKAIAIAEIIMNAEVGSAKALGMGPFGIPMASIIKAMGYAKAGVVAGLAINQVSGGRLTGGPVSPGKIYPVSEDGKPEILDVLGKQYLLPGKTGKVVPNNKIGGDGGGVVVNIVNNVQASVSTRTSTSPSGGETIEVMIDKAVANNLSRATSNTTMAMRGSYGAQPILTRR